MKKYLITGLVILLPIAITFLVISFILDIFTAPFLDLATNILSKMEKPLPFLASKEILTIFSKIFIIILFCIFIFLLGVLTRIFFFKYLLSLLNKIFMKIPFFKSIYHTAKDMIASLLSVKEEKAFKHPVLVNYPSKKSKCIGFASGKTPKEIEEKTKLKLDPVFIPTAPHPISGYLIFFKKEDIEKVKMTNEEAIKYTISCGVIRPEDESNIF